MNNVMRSRYDKLIQFAKSQTVNGYYEKHHIIPKSFGGTDNEENIVYLTPRQHYVAHWMLWKIYGSHMTTAFNFMNGIHRYGKRLNSRTAALLKEQEIKRQKSKVFTKETRQKMSQAKLGSKLSDETKRKISLAQVGRVYDEEYRKKISVAKKGQPNGRLGKKLSEETKQKIIYANFNRPIIQCPRCLKSMKDHGGAKRWHFDNCKEQKRVA